MMYVLYYMFMPKLLTLVCHNYNKKGRKCSGWSLDPLLKYVREPKELMHWHTSTNSITVNRTAPTALPILLLVSKFLNISRTSNISHVYGLFCLPRFVDPITQ